MKRYLGVDLHKDNFTVCYLDSEDNKIFKEYKLTSLNRFKKTLNPEDEIAVEAIANSRIFCEELVTIVEKVVLVAPGNFKIISSSSKKTDKRDAETLAEFLMMGKLPEARIMNKQQAYIKSILKTREKFVKQRTQCKNKIHNILIGNGVFDYPKKPFTKKGFEFLRNLKCDPLVKKEIELLVKHIIYLNESISEIENELKKEENQLPQHKNLTSIKGIGDVTAAIFTSGIGNIDDFEDKKNLNSYFGMIPSVRQSNNTIHYGRITKKGNRMVRAALVQCTLGMISHNPILKEFYQRIKRQKGSGKAIIATARKLLEFIYFTLSNNIVWEDSNAGVIQSMSNSSV